MSINRNTPKGATIGDERKVEFAKRLRQLMIAKGWNQSEVSRRVGVGRDVISGYMNARHYPDPPNQGRLAAAFGLDIETMFPDLSVLDVPGGAPLEFKTLPDGTAMLNVKMRVPTEIALKVVALLAEHSTTN